MGICFGDRLNGIETERRICCNVKQKLNIIRNSTFPASVSLILKMMLLLSSILAENEMARFISSS